MDKMYQGIIYTVKHCGHSREAIIDFLHRYTSTPKEYYTNSIIDRIMEQTMLEAVRYNLNPVSILFEYFSWMKDPWNYSHFDAMCAALGSIQVRERIKDTDNYSYINGFTSVIDEFEGEKL